MNELLTALDVEQGSTPEERFKDYQKNSSVIGKRQKMVINLLMAGCHISVLQELSNAKHSIEILDDDGNVYEMPKMVFLSLVKNGFIECQKTYSTVSPDTETRKYFITDNFKRYLEK